MRSPGRSSWVARRVFPRKGVDESSKGGWSGCSCSGASGGVEAVEAVAVAVADAVASRGAATGVVILLGRLELCTSKVKRVSSEFERCSFRARRASKGAEWELTYTGCSV